MTETDPLVPEAPDGDRLRRRERLAFGHAGDFDDPTLERRRLFAELFGTFLLVLAGAGGPVVDGQSGGAIGRVATVAAPGLTVMAVILSMGAVSGAHLNPVVTIAFAARGDFPWKRVPGYIVVQLLGAAAACLFLWAAVGRYAELGATVPGPGVSTWQAVLVELALTTGLVSVILGTASGAQNVGMFGAIAVGGYIVLAGLWSSPISGASMNPARSFGPDVVLLDFTAYWAYVVGPLAGALLAVPFAWLLRGPGGGRTSRLAAQGKLSEPEGRDQQGP